MPWRKYAPEWRLEGVPGPLRFKGLTSLRIAVPNGSAVLTHEEFTSCEALMSATLNAPLVRVARWLLRPVDNSPCVPT